MRRLFENNLVKWKDNHRRKPLIIRGARQVGKTYSVIEFGKKYFENHVVVDFERNPELRNIFKGNLQPKRICSEIEILLKERITAGKTLLFLDEIQECPQAISALRYFYEEYPDLHVIAAGSLLEFAMKDYAVPVGRVQFLHLYPLCFAEYLQAIGNEEAMNIVLGPPCWVSQAVHEFLIDELRRYFFIGGMPESVMAYKETGSIRESFDVQAEICETYRMDFAKYQPKTDRFLLNAVLESVARGVGRQIKYSRLADGFTNPTLRKAFELLCLADIVHRIPAANPSGLPLRASASFKIFKALLVDIGLMRYLSGMPVDVEYNSNDLLDIYRGAMAEQFVGQEMRVSLGDDLFYWARKVKGSSAEIDYLIASKGRIIPVEVKSGSVGRLKSLHSLLNLYKNINGGVVLSANPYIDIPEKKVTCIPLYFAYSLTMQEACN